MLPIIRSTRAAAGYPVARQAKSELTRTECKSLFNHSQPTSRTMPSAFLFFVSMDLSDEVAEAPSGNVMVMHL
jgi:hypothetical protein